MKVRLVRPEELMIGDFVYGKTEDEKDSIFRVTELHKNKVICADHQGEYKEYGTIPITADVLSGIKEFVFRENTKESRWRLPLKASAIIYVLEIYFDKSIPRIIFKMGGDRRRSGVRVVLEMKYIHELQQFARVFKKKLNIRE